MDIFNKNKVLDLEIKIQELEEKLKIYEGKAGDKVKHKTGVWCKGCKNLIIDDNYAIVSSNCFPTRYCILDNECKDRISG